MHVAYHIWFAQVGIYCVSDCMQLKGSAHIAFQTPHTIIIFSRGFWRFAPRQWDYLDLYTKHAYTANLCIDIVLRPAIDLIPIVWTHVDFLKNAFSAYGNCNGLWYMHVFRCLWPISRTFPCTYYSLPRNINSYYNDNYYIS